MARATVAVQVPQSTYEKLADIATKYDVPIGQAIEILESQYRQKLEEKRQKDIETLKEEVERLKRKVGEETEPVTFKCPYCFKEFDSFKKLSAHVRATQDTEHGGKGYPEDWESRKRAIKSELEVEEEQSDRSKEIDEILESIKI